MTIKTKTTLLLCALACSVSTASAQAGTISWKGIEWNTKSGTGKNPGRNSWSPANAFVDANGDLHLALTNVNGTWTCAEVWTDATFGFGTFQWQVQTAVDDLDPNVVLGLFVYGPPALGPDGTHEIDIEYARFGSATADNGRWTIFPNVLVAPPLLGRSSFPFLLGANPATTSRFTWTPTSVAFTTLAGVQPAGSTSDAIHSWTYQPADPTTTISQSPMSVHMNLWLYQGQPPTNGQAVEVVIHDFGFTPAAAPSAVPALPSALLLILTTCLLGVGLLFVKDGHRQRRSSLTCNLKDASGDAAEIRAGREALPGTKSECLSRGQESGWAQGRSQGARGG